MKSIAKLIIVLVVIVVVIKFVEPVNNWARGNLPQEVLALIGEKPKSIFEKSSDFIGDNVKKGTGIVEDIIDKVKK
ncbi:hypothetical protein KKA14_17035 [bacterium]|nr:hypothetical protein [bacterium]